MADSVQFFMEKMIPDLEELQNSGLFNKSEIKAIIKKRRDFEYAIARPGKSKVDFLRYIEYEFTLDALRRKRADRLGVLKRNGAPQAIRHISNIFVRCLRKFKGDVRLWLQFIDYSTRIGSYNALNRTFAEALQYHPTNHKLWIMAASWEYTNNLNVAAARTLLQRALRIMPDCQELYVEYIRLELMYREKIEQRMQLMGIDQAALEAKKDQAIDLTLVPEKGEDDDSENGEEKQEKDEIDELLEVPVPEGDPAALKKAAEERAATAWRDTMATGAGKNPFFEGVVIRVIYNAAIQRIPQDVQFRKKILSVVQLFKNSDNIQDEIYTSLERDFPENDYVTLLIARRPVDSLLESSREALFDAIRQAIDSIDNEILVRILSPNDFGPELRLTCQALFLQRVDSAGIRELYAEFLMEQLARVSKDAEAKVFIARKLQNAFQEAIKSGKATEKIFAHQIAYFLDNGKLPEALDASSNSVKAFPQSSDLWTLRLKMLSQLRSLADKAASLPAKVKTSILSIEELFKIFDAAVKSCGSKASARLWDLYVATAVAAQQTADQLLALFSRGAKQLKGDELNAWKSFFLERTSKYLPIEKIREFTQRAFEFYPTKLDFYQKCIEYEQSQIKVDPARVRQLFEYALREFGAADDDLWLAFIQWELRVGNLKEATALYWRAKKALKMPDDFIVKHANLINSGDPEKALEGAATRSAAQDDEDSSVEGSSENDSSDVDDDEDEDAMDDE